MKNLRQTAKLFAGLFVLFPSLSQAANLQIDFTFTGSPGSASITLSNVSDGSFSWAALLTSSDISFSAAFAGNTWTETDIDPAKSPNQFLVVSGGASAVALDGSTAIFFVFENNSNPTSNILFIRDSSTPTYFYGNGSFANGLDQGVDGSGSYTTSVTTVIPEPSTALLLAFGLVAMSASRCRSRAQVA